MDSVKVIQHTGSTKDQKTESLIIDNINHFNTAQDRVGVETDGGQQSFILKHGGLIGLNSVILPVCSDVCLQMMCLFRWVEPRDAMALRPD